MTTNEQAAKVHTIVDWFQPSSTDQLERTASLLEQLADDDSYWRTVAQATRTSRSSSGTRRQVVAELRRVAHSTTHEDEMTS